MPFRAFGKAALGAGFAVLLGFIGLPSLAADKEVTLELNKLESLPNACRAYFLIRNQGKDDFEDIKLDIFIFDKEGVISRRFAISTGQLRPGKTVVRLFDIPDLDCQTAARFLLNEVMSCTGPTGPIETCGRQLAVTARGGVVFEY